MAKRNYGRLILIAGTVTVVAWGADRAEAGPLMNWIQQRRAARQAARMQRRMTAYYPVTVAASTYTYAQAVPQQQVVVRYAPTVSYRTIWTSVPVTQYRPVTSGNAFAAGATYMSPCTTYEWQARRVPYTTYQPVYSRAAVASPSACNACAVVPASTSAVVASPAYAAAGAYAPSYASAGPYSPGYSSGIGCSGCSPSSAVVPYSAPVIQSPQPSAPMLTPGTAPSSTPLSPVPAQQAPSLSPDELRDAARGEPANGQQPQAGASIQPNSSGENKTSDAAGFPTVAPPINGPARPASSESTPTGTYPKPIPDPEPRHSDLQDNRAPGLLDDGDRTAARHIGRRWEAVPVSWPAIETSHELDSRSRPSRDEASQWDDRGWHRSTR